MALLLAIVSLSGCGGGGGGTDTETLSNVNLVGSVGDGPITGATITVKDANGIVVGTTESDATAKYKISVPGGTEFPVTITATGGTDIVSGTIPDFNMVTVAFKKADLNSKKRTVNINPFSTFIVYMANNMSGGLSVQNIAAAKQTIYDKFSFGLDSTLLPDPISSDITDANIANVIKASEALGEMIRRTRDSMITAGNNIDGNAVIEKLANDLADGSYDGAGINADNRISAISKITSTQVLIEYIQNRLKVNDIVATTQLDNAIQITRPTSSISTADVALTDEVLSQTQLTLSASERYASSTELSDLISAINGLTSTSSISDINTLVPAGSEDALDAMIDSAPLATEDELSYINTGSETPTDTSEALAVAPVITTNPVLTVQEGVAYSYDVDATDANSGDSLSYELTAAPAGMSINSSTGLISWTPTVVQVGTQDVTIRVADNSSRSLSASQGFTITVSGLAMLRISNTTPATYTWDTLENGKLIFSDRTYLFGASTSDQVHPSYAGMNYLATAKDDKTTTGETHVSFDVNTPVTAYVAHADTITNKPAWLNTWSDTGEDTLSRSIYRKEFDAGKITLGGNTVDGINNGSMYLVFIEPRVQVSGTIIITDPINGSVTTANNTSMNIGVANTASDTVTLEDQPANGTATIIEGNIIRYSPSTDFSGEDSITYTITDANGDISVATLTITVTCTDCTTVSVFDLYWDSANGSEVGYRIYYGTTASNASTLGYDVAASSMINPQAPSAVIRSDELGLQSGDSACFRIKAYDNANNTSDYSSAVCTTI